MDTMNKSSDTIDETASIKTATEEKPAKEETNPKFLQLEDSTLDHLPKHVEQLLNNLPTKSQTYLLIGLIYCVAVETGFAEIESISTESTAQQQQQQSSTDKSSITTEDKTTASSSLSIVDSYSYFWGFSYNSKFVNNILQIIPKNYDDLTNTNLYKLKLNLINFSIINCILVGIQTGEYLILTLTIDGSTGKSICLSIPRYVLSSSLSSSSSSSSNNIKIQPNLFRNLKELSYILKEKLFIPTRNTLMEESNKLYPGLNGLPIELLNILLKFLKIKDIQNLSKICWKMRCCCVDYYEFRYKPIKKPYGSKSGGDNNNNGQQNLRTTNHNIFQPNRLDGINYFNDYLN